VPNTRELNNTLERLRALSQQTQPPTQRANPIRGGAPQVGGSPTGDITATLSATQQGAIGDKVRECWGNPGFYGIDKISVQLLVTYDEQGIARVADIGPEDRGRMADARFKAFAEQAVRAVLDVRCSALPIPKSDLGRVGKLTFRFKP
jgi:hypothetical protein